MFAKSIIGSDAFIEMPLSTQALYFHLGMQADDDGFVNSPKRVQRGIGGSEDDLKLLIAKGFIIPFDSGVVVIKHWNINNYIRKDRYISTNYTEEKEMLGIKQNGGYFLKNPCLDMVGIPSVNQVATENRLEENSLVKSSITTTARAREESLLSEEDFTLVFKTWGKCAITRLTERVMEELTALAEEYGPENVVDAIKTAAEQGKVNLAYIKGILRNRASGVDKPKKLNSEEEKTLFFKRMYEKALAEEEEEERRNAQNRND